MSFFDNVKKAAVIAGKGVDLARKGLDMADEQVKKKVSRMSDSELKGRDSSNKHIRDELQKRGL